MATNGEFFEGTRLDTRHTPAPSRPTQLAHSIEQSDPQSQQQPVQSNGSQATPQDTSQPNQQPASTQRSIPTIPPFTFAPQAPAVYNSPYGPAPGAPPPPPRPQSPAPSVGLSQALLAAVTASQNPVSFGQQLRHASQPGASGGTRGESPPYDRQEHEDIVAQAARAAEMAIKGMNFQGVGQSSYIQGPEQPMSGHGFQPPPGFQPNAMYGDAGSVPFPTQSAPTQVLYERARQAATAKSSPTSRRAGLPSQRRPWTNEEENALMAGLDRVKGPHWSQILAMFGPGGTINESLKDRNQVQLKDKARNLKLFFLKSGIEVPYYLQCVTGELKTRAPAIASKNEAKEREKQQGEADKAHIEGVMALGGLQQGTGESAGTPGTNGTPAPTGTPAPSQSPAPMQSIEGHSQQEQHFIPAQHQQNQAPVPEARMGGPSSAQQEASNEQPPPDFPMPTGPKLEMSDEQFAAQLLQAQAAGLGHHARQGDPSPALPEQ